MLVVHDSGSELNASSRPDHESGIQATVWFFGVFGDQFSLLTADVLQCAPVEMGACDRVLLPET